MISIVCFTLQDFNPVEIDTLRIEELGNLAGRQEPFVVIYNKQYHFSAFIVPELMNRLINELDVSPNDSAEATGLLDLLRQGQITVGDGESASRVARLAVMHDIEVVIVTNPYAIPVGLFIPSEVTKRLPHTSLFKQGSIKLQETINQLTRVDDLPRAIMAIEGEFTSYHSELLTFHAIKPLICEDTGVWHFIFDAQCTTHPGAIVR
jgi:hypothetical protein